MNSSQKNRMKCLCFLTLAIFGLLIWAKGLSTDSWTSMAKAVPQVVTIDALIVVAFQKWLWKWPIFHPFLVARPNLNGTWVGSTYSNWVDPKTGIKAGPIPTMLTIVQTMNHTSCVIHTGESKSYSLVAGFQINPDQQLKRLSYNYENTPRKSLDSRSGMHRGGAIFDIVEQPNRELHGTYWTDRNTSGEIVLKFHSKKQLEKLPEGLGEHPVTEPENRR